MIPAQSLCPWCDSVHATVNHEVCREVIASPRELTADDLAALARAYPVHVVARARSGGEALICTPRRGA